MSSVARLSAALAGRYSIERELGSGGMATVYLAHDIRHRRHVALKVLRPELSAILGAERFLEEIKTTANLQHPHILPLFDSGEADGLVFYVMPYVEGESLRDRLRREHQLPVSDALRIATEVAGALDYAHRHHVIHRDIKPENILLHDGRALVSDFGIALAVSRSDSDTRLTETGMSLGTPHYMSPEQAMGERDLTPQSDVYALGCVMYEMLIGEPPFTGPTAQAIVAKVMTAQPAPIAPRRNRVPAHVEDAVLTALDKVPADRFASAAQFADALTQSERAPRSSRRGGARRSWIPLGLAAGAGAAIAALILWGLGPPGSRNDERAFIQKSFAPQAIFRARFAPDGQTIVYSAALEGNRPRLYVLRPDVPAPSTLGPDGTHLLAISSRGDLAVLLDAQYIAHQLFTGTLAQMRLGDTAPRELLPDVREADWSPDGASLAIIRIVDGKDRLEYPVGQVLYESAGYLSDLRVSPSGDRIAIFEHPRRWDDRGAVIVVDRTGQRTLLTDGYDALEGLAWDAGGRAVLFSGSIAGEYREVRSVDLGGGVRRLLPSPGILTIHDVSSTGHWLVTSDVEQDRLFARAPGERADRDLTWLDRSQSPLLSADGRSIVFTNAALDAGHNYATMLRPSGGGPAINLGEGGAFDVSPDGRWALSIIDSPPQVMLYPTGAGQGRRLDGGAFQAFSGARFFPDGRSVVLCGNEPGRAPRCYAKPLSEGSAMRPLTPEGTDDAFVSPDGRDVVARLASGGYRIYGVTSGTERAIPSLTAEDQIVGWSPDGRALRVQTRTAIPMRVERLDLATGRRSLLVVSAPENRAGLLAIPRVSLARDPGTYAYWTRVFVSQLYTVEER